VSAIELFSRLDASLGMAVLDPAALKNHSRLFALLDDVGRQRLVGAAVEETVPPKEVVLFEGDLGDSFFLVVDGELSVRIGGKDEKSEVARLGPASFFGEIAALLGEKRSATVVCLQRSRMVKFDGRKVQTILKDYPKVREALVKLGLKRSEENLQQMVEEDFPGVPVTTEGSALSGSVVSASCAPAKPPVSAEGIVPKKK